MAVSAQQKEVKVVIKFIKGSQTIGNCNQAATDENLYTLGYAIGTLNKEEVDEITKVTETTLKKQGN